jgi:hypothetical protein
LALLLLRRLTLLRNSLALLLLRLTLLRCRLTPLRSSLALLLRSSLALLLLRLTLLRCRLALLRSCLALLLLRYSTIGCLQRRWSPYVAICSKRPGDGHTSRPTMVDIRKLRSVGAGGALIFDLCPHGSGVLLMHRC